jgi:hypothetical protein
MVKGSVERDSEVVASQHHHDSLCFIAEPLGVLAAFHDVLRQAFYGGECVWVRQ